MIMHSKRFHMEAVVSAGLAILLYMNTLGFDFVYDDSRAIVKNLDIRPTVPITDLLHHDFWGTPMSHTGSHKSFRPVTVLTFRINFAISGLQPWTYHLFNVLLHSFSTWLFVTFLKLRVFHRQKNCNELSLHAGIYFAVHPIHTEAVSGVVGRADILSAIFVFASLLCYSSYCDQLEFYSSPQFGFRAVDNESRNVSGETTSRGKNSGRKLNKKNRKKSNFKTKRIDGQRSTDNLQNSLHSAVSSKSTPREISENRGSRMFVMEILTNVCAVLAIFSKETGFCALPLCIAYDLWLRSNLGFSSIFKVLFTEAKFPVYKRLRKRIWRLVISTCIVVAIRVLPWTLLTKGYTVPNFSSADNPTSADESFLTRSLTFNYLILHNLMLMILPVTLSYDWGGVPLVESLADSRTLYTALFYTMFAVCLHRLWVVLRRRDNDFEGRFQTSILKQKGQSRRTSNDHIPKNVEYLSENVDHEMTGVRTNVTLVKPKSKSQHLLHSVADEGISLDAIEYEPPTDHDKYTSNISLSRFMLDHVKSSATGHVEKAESTQSSGYATESSEEGQQDDVSRCQVIPPCHKQNCSFPTKCRLENTAGFDAVNTTVLSLCLLIIPFLPATNVFFYVGFMVAERVLYLPSAGLCILIALGWQKGINSVQKRAGRNMFRTRISRISFFLKFFVLFALSLRTLHRNSDWKNEYHLYRSGISTSPAKSWSNLGNVMKESGRIKTAESCYLNALRVRGNMADVHYNLGLLYQEQKRYAEALERYHLAITFRKTLAVAYLNSGFVLSELGRVDEAEKMYHATVKLDDAGLRDPHAHAKAKISAMYNLGCLLSSQNRHEEAVTAFEDAIRRLTPDYEPQSLYNMLGQSLHKVGRLSEAEVWFKSSLRLKPDHIPAHLTYALLMRDKGSFLEAKKLYRDAIRLNPHDHNAYNHFAKLLIYEENLTEASEMITRAYQTKTGKSDYDTIMLAGDIFRLMENLPEAEKFYRIAVNLEPNTETVHVNLGAILHLQDKYAEAKSCYQSALLINPSSEMTKNNLQKLENRMKGK